MSTVLSKKTEKGWQLVEDLLFIDSEADYKRARQALDELADEVGNMERHPKAPLMDTLGTLVHAWEEAHHPIPKASPRKVLAFLMEEHGLRQQDLKEVGTQGIVSEILSGKRELNIRQIRKLSKKFGVSPAVFVG
jgi:HTH-type transcriptional regulator/antitoxin HigA